MTDATLKAWREKAERQQQEWQELRRDSIELGNTTVDIFDKKEGILLIKKKIGYSMFGPPTSLPSYENEYTGYKKNQVEHIGQILHAVLDRSDENYVLMSYILLVIKPKEDSSDACTEIVLRIHKDINNSSSVFIDRHCRIYTTWKNFKKNNLLPKCIYYCPPDDDCEAIEFNVEQSPACSLVHEAVNTLDSVATVASVATLGTVIAGSFVTLAPVIVAGTAVCTIGVGAYSGVRGVTSLVDRKTHGQSISITDKEARQSWLSIGTSALAGVGAAGFSRIQHAANSGREISKATIRTVHVLNGANVVLSGVSIMDSMLYCSKKLCDNQTLTPQDIFNLSCEILFFFNAIKSVKVTKKLMSIVKDPCLTQNTPTTKLTNLMKRCFRKRKATMKQQLNTAVCESNYTYCAITQKMVNTAFFSIVPNAEEIKHAFYSLGHDLRSVREGNIDLSAFLLNSYKTVKYLYTCFRKEIDLAVSEMKNLFDNMEKYISKAKDLIISASQTAKAYFNCVLLWVKLKFEKCMEYISIIIGNLYKEKNIDSEEEELNDSSDFLEPYERVLSKMNKLIEQDDLKINTLEEYAHAFDRVCTNIMHSLKDKILDYQLHCKLFAELNPETGIDTYNSKLGINGDPEEHFLNKLLDEDLILNKLLDEDLNKSMKNKMKQLYPQTSKNWSKNFEFMLNIDDDDDDSKFYYCIDKEENGCLPSKAEILNVVSKVTKKNITFKSIKIKQNETGAVAVILPKEDDTWYKGIFVNCALIANNTHDYLIMVI